MADQELRRRHPDEKGDPDSEVGHGVDILQNRVQSFMWCS